MNDCLVEPKSRTDLREIAYLFRKWLSLEHVLFFPVVEVLDLLSLINNDFNYEIVNDDILPNNTHADIDIKTGLIRIKESVFIGACNNRGRDRMTIAHEIGHFVLLCQYGFKLERSFSLEKIPAYQDSEWQAKCFAGELMIPAHLVKGMSKREIVEKCGVSPDAANTQYKHLLKE